MINTMTNADPSNHTQAVIEITSGVVDMVWSALYLCCIRLGVALWQSWREVSGPLAFFVSSELTVFYLVCTIYRVLVAGCALLGSRVFFYLLVFLSAAYAG